MDHLLLFSCSVMSNSLWPRELQHTRLFCPPPSPGACLNSRPSSQWCIQPSHSLLSPSPPAFNVSQHQGLFQWVSSSHQVAKMLELQLHISPSNEYSALIFFRIDGLISLQSKGLSRVFSNTIVQKHQFFGAQLSLSSTSKIHTWLLAKPWLWLCDPHRLLAQSVNQKYMFL